MIDLEDIQSEVDGLLPTMDYISDDFDQISCSESESDIVGNLEDARNNVQFLLEEIDRLIEKTKK